MHYKDTSRNKSDQKQSGEYFRLFGVDDDGNTFFYWSETAGEYAAFYGRGYDAVWGTLTCKNPMLPENKVFIADLEMVRKLEKFEIMRPCGNCNRVEYKRWQEANEG